MSEKKHSVVKVLEKVVEKLLKDMTVKASIEVSEDKESELFKVNLDTEGERGLLIGRKGETLEAIQTVISLIMKQKTGEWYRIQVNVGEWREKQAEYLQDLARKTAERAIETGEPQNLYNLNSQQRRIIHLEIKTIKDVKSESQGEGEERYLVVKPK